MVASDKSRDGGAVAAPLPALRLRPRDERFAVVVAGRAARAGHVPFQIAIPQELYRRLRYESLGSINQVMVALVRQALTWLDADSLTLHAEVNPGPEPRSLDAARRMPEGLADSARREFERGLDDLWPNARLSTRPRVDDRVVVQVERQPRVDAQLIQIALPPELQQRLVREGIGAASQLVISLARYGLRRLDEEGATLDVHPVSSKPSGIPEKASARQNEIDVASVPITGPSLTVTQLIGELSKHPPEAFVVFEERAGCWWDFHEVALVRLSPGNPYDEFSDEADQPETSIVVLRGEASVLYEPLEDDVEFTGF